MDTSTSTTTLPSTPSELIRLALEDLRACERDDRYEVDMWDLHNSREGQRGQMVCHVCLAGAVLAQTLGVPRDRSICGRDLARYRSSVQDRLRALDHFRLGEISAGLSYLGYDVDKLSEEWQQYARKSRYNPADPEAFHVRMNNLADYLASCGL